MKVLSLWQPWASLLVLGWKQFETRSWYTSYRGPLAIHAAKHYSQETARFASTAYCADCLRRSGTEWGRLSFGGIVGVCDLTDCLKITADFEVSLRERAVGNYEPGRFAWKTRNPLPFDSMIPMRGYQQLFGIPSDTAAEISRRIRPEDCA